jgi:hypothetical protein
VAFLTKKKNTNVTQDGIISVETEVQRFYYYKWQLNVITCSRRNFVVPKQLMRTATVIKEELKDSMSAVESTHYINEATLCPFNCKNGSRLA